MPRKEVVLPLMKETFHGRRQDILHSDDSVVSKLMKYSALKMPSVVSNYWFSNSYYDVVARLNKN